MKLKERLKMNLESNLKIKFIILFSVLSLVVPSISKADPVIAGEVLPPASATMVTDPDLIKKIAVGRENEPVWCYSNDANAIIISAPQRQREQCQLELQQELEKANTNCNFSLRELTISLETLTERHEKMLSLKNNQIEELTQAALKRPNDYSFWWATGGVATGVLTTLAIMLAVSR